MYFFLKPSFLSNCRWTFAPQFFLFTILYFPHVFYASFATRLTSMLLLWMLTAAFYQLHEISDPLTAYMMGASVMWNFLYGTVLILLKSPAKEFKRLQRVEDKVSGSVLYVWQPFPNHYISRICWVLDLIASPRGLGWCHQYRKRLEHMPIGVRALYLNEVEGSVTGAKSESTTKKANSCCQSKNIENQQSVHVKRSSFTLQRCIRIIRDIVIIYILSYLVFHDTFMNGTGDLNPFRIPRDRAIRWILLVPYRVALGLVGSYSMIDLYMTFTSLVNVSILGPHIIGTWGEPWMNPPVWGNISAVYERGIAGFWGNFWHDMLTYGIASLSSGLFQTKCIPPKTQAPSPSRTFRHTLRFHSMFIMSGILHAAASYAQPQETYPWLTFFSFALQGVGIGLQEYLRLWLLRLGLSEFSTKAVILITTTIWAFLTAPLFLADLAVGRMTMTANLPIRSMEIMFGNKKKLA